MVDDVIGLMDHLKIERAHLVGHSMGALIAANCHGAISGARHERVAVAGPLFPDRSDVRGHHESRRWIADLESGAGLINFIQSLSPALNAADGRMERMHR